MIHKTNNPAKNILLFCQSESSGNTYIQKAYGVYGHSVTVVFLNDSTKLDAQKGLLTTNRDYYLLKEFDLAYFRTWGGTEARNLAHQWQPILEKHGVPCIDSLQAKLYNHNKHKMMRLFQKNKIPMPRTVIIDKGTHVDECIQAIKENFKGIIVFKGEGCAGRNIQFIEVADEVQLRSIILEKYSIKKLVGPSPLVLQQYLPSKNQEGYSYYYRILVIGNEVMPVVKCYTARKNTILAPNSSKYVMVSEISTNEVFSSEQQEDIRRVCKLTKTNIAGVDATILQGKLYIFEVNNSPVLGGWPSRYMEKIVSYTTQHLAR